MAEESIESDAPRGRFMRRRRENADTARTRRFVVKVTPEEELLLRSRAEGLRVTVARLMVESALSDEVWSVVQQRALLAELGAVRNLLGNVANNVNQLARFANREGHFIEEDARGYLQWLRALYPRVEAAFEAAALSRRRAS